MPQNYSFTTHWYVSAPFKEVWEVIYKSEEWPQWWKDVLSVTEIEKGDERGIGSIRVYKLKSPTGYTLSFNLLLTEREEYKCLSGKASGELEGTGSWHFGIGEGITHVSCHWDVHTNIGWMNAFAFMLKPIFKLNHKIVMKRGARCLARKLQTDVSCN